MDMSELVRAIERSVVRDLCRDNEVPEDVWILIDSLMQAGCNATKILKGLSIFSERISEKNETEALKELLKGLPIKFEEE